MVKTVLAQFYLTRQYKMAAFVVISVAQAVAFTGSALSAELVVFESKHCGWCRLWNEEIGSFYHKTREGKLAPLRRVDVDKPTPSDLSFITYDGATPTFVLIEHGKEIGRIRGYPGEDHFWGLLGQLVDQSKAATSLEKKN